MNEEHKQTRENFTSLNAELESTPKQGDKYINNEGTRLQEGGGQLYDANGNIMQISNANKIL